MNISDYTKKFIKINSDLINDGLWDDLMKLCPKEYLVELKAVLKSSIKNDAYINKMIEDDEAVIKGSGNGSMFSIQTLNQHLGKICSWDDMQCEMSHKFGESIAKYINVKFHAGLLTNTPQTAITYLATNLLVAYGLRINEIKYTLNEIQDDGSAFPILYIQF